MKTRITSYLLLSSAVLFGFVQSPARGQEVIESRADEEIIEVTYTVPAPDITVLSDGFTSVILEGEGFSRMFGSPGSPVLPARSVRMLLPPDREVMEVEVIPGKKIAVKGEYQVEFARIPRPISAPPVETDDEKPDPAIYASSAPYPGRLDSPPTIQYLRGYPILTMLLHPVEYIPSEGKLSYYQSLTIRVKHGPVSRALDRQSESIMPRRGLASDEERVRSAVDNPGAMKMFK